MQKQAEKPIEYESISIEVPKQVMELLRFAESLAGMSPKEWIEYYIVETARSGLDSDMFVPEPKELAEKFGLNPVFKKILDETIQ
jgi:hypothetical protein